jgi:hypothetical protein
MSTFNLTGSSSSSYANVRMVEARNDTTRQAEENRPDNTKKKLSTQAKGVHTMVRCNFS